MITENGLYAQIIQVTEEYLGPTAERFVERQITHHLHKPPDQVDAQDVLVFIKWAKISLGLLTEDQSIITEYTEKITSLALKGRIKS